MGITTFATCDYTRVMSLTGRSWPRRIVRVGFIAAAYFVIGAVLCVTIAFGLAIRGVPHEPVDRDDKSAVGVLLVDSSDGVILYPSRNGWGWTVYETARYPTPSHTSTAITLEPSAGFTADPALQDVRLISHLPDRRHLPEETGARREEVQFGIPFRAFWGGQQSQSGTVASAIRRSPISAIWEVDSHRSSCVSGVSHTTQLSHGASPPASCTTLRRRTAQSSARGLGHSRASWVWLSGACGRGADAALRARTT